MQITCSCCGNHTEVRRTVESVKKTTASGWRSYGGVIYCPECARTWNERNKTTLNSVQETNEWIYNRLLKRKDHQDIAERHIRAAFGLRKEDEQTMPQNTNATGANSNVSEETEKFYIADY